MSCGLGHNNIYYVQSLAERGIAQKRVVRFRGGPCRTCLHYSTKNRMIKIGTPGLGYSSYPMKSAYCKSRGSFLDWGDNPDHGFCKLWKTKNRRKGKKLPIRLVRFK